MLFSCSAETLRSQRPRCKEVQINGKRFGRQNPQISDGLRFALSDSMIPAMGRSLLGQARF
jgi:hypothetical protein